MFGPPSSPLPAVASASADAPHLLLRKLAQQAPLDGEQQAALARCLSARVQTVGRNVALVEAGEYPADIFVLLEGWACSTRPAAEGRPPIVALHLPGDVCDFGALMKQHMDCTIVALSRLKVAAVSRSAVARLGRDHPHCAQALWWDFMCGSAIRSQWIARLSRGSARARLADLLCELAVRLRAVGLADDRGFALPITQVELGHSCGLTPEHTNRVLRDLRMRNIVAWEKDRMVLTDWGALQQEAAFDPAYLHFRALET